MEEQIRQIVKEELSKFISINNYTFDRDIIILDGKRIRVGRTKGTEIGGALKLTETQLAFFGGALTGKLSTIADPAGGATIDSEARAAINTIIDRLQALNLIA
jgi:hypothetical protein